MKKSILLGCLLALNTLSIFPITTTGIIATATAVPIVGNLCKDRSDSYVAAALTKTATNCLSNITSKDAAKFAFKYGTLATIISYCIHNPAVVRSACDIATAGFQGTCGNIAAVFDSSFDLMKSAWRNKWTITITTGKMACVIGTVLAANHLARGEKSLAKHVLNRGLPGIFPAIIDQGVAVVNYTLTLFQKQ